MVGRTKSKEADRLYVSQTSDNSVCAQVQLLHWDYNCQTRRDHYFSSYYIDLLSYLSILYDLIGNYNFNPNTLCDFLHSLVVGT